MGDDGLWKLLDPVIKSLPDQGIDRGRKRKNDHEGKEDRSDRSPLARKRSAAGSAEASENKAMRQCLVCKKKHWPLCKLPEGFRKRMREEVKTKKAEAAKSKASAPPRGSE